MSPEAWGILFPGPQLSPDKGAVTQGGDDTEASCESFPAWVPSNVFTPEKGHPHTAGSVQRASYACSQSGLLSIDISVNPVELDGGTIPSVILTHD